MLLRTVPMLLLFAALAPAAPLPLPRDVEPAFRDFRSLGRLTPWGGVIGTTPDGRRLVLRGHSTFLFVLDLTSGKVLHELHTRESIQDAALSPDGTLLA